MSFLTDCMRGKPIETRCGYRAEFVSFNWQLPAPLLIKVYKAIDGDRYDMCAEDYDISPKDKVAYENTIQLIFASATKRVEIDNGVLENYYTNGTYLGSMKNHYMDLCFADTLESDFSLDEECMYSRRSLTLQEEYKAEALKS